MCDCIMVTETLYSSLLNKYILIFLEAEELLMKMIG